jgi:hypothetical protein
VSHTRATVLTLLVTALAVLPLSSAHGTDTWSEPYPGVRRVHRVTSNTDANVLIIDLCAAGIRARATAVGERGRTVGSFGTLVGAQIAINGDFYSSGWGVDGLAMSGGAAWPGESDHGYVAPFAVGDGQVSLVPHEVVAGPEAWAREIVSGHPTILWDGATRDNNGDPLCSNRHPRTAIGLSADRRTLILAVVDGRATSRIGMTCDELAALLREFGAHYGMNMDGGGSSTMWIASAGVVNHPSDGSSRTVSNHLAIYAGGGGEPAHCVTPRFAAEYVTSAWGEGTHIAREAGVSQSGSITLRNVGRATWPAGLTRIGMTQPRDMASPLQAADWLSANRAAALAADVPPGSEGTFTFSLRAPDTPGTYRQYFNLLVEGVAWFSDTSSPPDDFMWVEVTSVPPVVVEPDAGVAEDAGRSDADAGGLLDGGHGDVCGVCEIGELACRGRDVVYCDADGDGCLRWFREQSCGAELVCFAGQCVEASAVADLGTLDGGAGDAGASGDGAGSGDGDRGAGGDGGSGGRDGAGGGSTPEAALDDGSDPRGGPAVVPGCTCAVAPAGGRRADGSPWALMVSLGLLVLCRRRDGRVRG